MNMIYWYIIIINFSHQWRWSPEQQLLLVDPVSDLSIHLQGFWHDQHPEAHQEGITIYIIWCPIVDDLGHTSSVTTQDTRYVDRRY